MRKWFLLFIALVLLCLVAVCAPKKAPPHFPGEQESFADYLRDMHDWVESRRAFQSQDHDAELAGNMPVELRPEGRPAGGILLVHGLGDSPFSFVDIEAELAAGGYLVRSILLPGHGTTPADMVGLSVEDWQKAVREQINLLRQETPVVWLGGFSTGANLVVAEAMNDPDIAGLLLFSPAFRSRFALDFLAPYASYLMTWWKTPEPGRPQQTMFDYLNTPMDALAAFYHSSSIVQSAMRKRTFQRPVLMVLAGHDATVDVEYAAKVFMHSFTHPDSRLIWYGRNVPAQDPRLLTRPDELPEKRITSFSHMSILFSPDNPFYGRNGSIRICQNGQDEQDARACKSAEKVWYSEWGDAVPGRLYARLTYNPYFGWQSGIMLQVISSKASGGS